MGVVSAVFWGVVVLSALVFVHEGGHFLAARACGMRVTEFYLGMPCRIKASRKSRKYGTEFGVTPILLGGYTRICGMEGTRDEFLARCFSIVQREGRVLATDVAAELGVDIDRAYDLLATLCDWASIRPYYDPEKGESPNQGSFPEAFETLARDANMLTEYDSGHDFAQPGSTTYAEPRPVEDEESALEVEKSHTYLGKGFLKRVFTLFAGPLVNVVLAFAIVTASLSIVGVTAAVNSNKLGGVEPDSYAQKAGLRAGDRITAIGGASVDDWTGIVKALDNVLGTGKDFSVTYARAGKTHTANVGVNGKKIKTFGIDARSKQVRLPVWQAASAALQYGHAVAKFAVQLIIPQQTMKTLSSASSVVGISAAASQAAASGANDLLLFIAMVSMSLGFMNLLPIPPLDGGKILIEVIQLVVRRPLSLRTQTIVSYVGLAFFAFIFVFALKNDITHLVFG
ncbi:MAG: M50 family metallopeptidase [Parafannyhessea sp.]|uniref:M50 family metallopeptidase n=1 Tax=Parafannyhessea sp. TaxID=2847324 RepID=UPI003F103E10